MSSFHFSPPPSSSPSSSLPRLPVRLAAPPLRPRAAAGFLLAAIGLYALASAPTPENPGFIHLAIAACFAASLISAGALSSLRLIFENRAQPFWALAGGIFIFYALLVPLPVALIHGQPSIAILRDLTGLAFWALPAFYLASPQRRFTGRFLRPALIAGLIGIGLMFSTRFLTSLYTVTGHITLAPAHPDIPLELVNVPSVLFAALYLSALALITLQAPSLRSKLKGLIYAGLAAIPVLAGIAALQRANLGGLVLICLTILIVMAFTRPLRMGWPLGLIALVLALIAPLMQEIIVLMLEKTRLVGLNMRFEEAEAVLNHLRRESAGNLLPATITGLGWGGGFISPAAGFREITFTHNFFLTLYLKTGIAGFFLGGIYVLALVACTLRFLKNSLYHPGTSESRRSMHLQKRIALGLAILIPLLVNIMLYATHKTLDFGLLLLLAACLDLPARHQISCRQPGRGRQEKTRDRQAGPY